jgi:hypothetical protein
VDDPGSAVRREQEDVLGARQANDLYGRAAVRRRLDRDVWRRLGSGVVVCHNGPLTERQRLWALLLAGPKGSALGGWSALAFDGMPDGFAQPGHLVVPGGRRRPDVREARVVYSRQLGPADVHPTRRPRRTRPVRSAVDAAVLHEEPASARLALVQVVQAGVVRPRELAAVLERRGQCRHLGVLRETVLDVEGGVRSIPELRFSRLVREAGLPPASRQAVVRGPAGRYYLDAEWPELLLAAEVHGVHHGAAAQQESDWRRHNELTLTGRHVLHFTSFAVRHRPEEVREVLTRAYAGRLAASGPRWAPPAVSA